MNQSMKAGAIPSLSYIRRCSKCLLWFLFIDNLNTVPGAKSPSVIHILTTKSLPEKNITSTIFIKQEIKEIFSVLDPRTEVQNKAYARSIHQLCCEAFSTHGSVLFNWNYWQHFDRSKACAWRVLSETVLLVNKGKKTTSLVDGLEKSDNEPDLVMTHFGVSSKLLVKGHLTAPCLQAIMFSASGEDMYE